MRPAVGQGAQTMFYVGEQRSFGGLVVAIAANVRPPAVPDPTRLGDELELGWRCRANDCMVALTPGRAYTGRFYQRLTRRSHPLTPSA